MNEWMDEWMDEWMTVAAIQSNPVKHEQRNLLKRTFFGDTSRLSCGL